MTIPEKPPIWKRVVPPPKIIQIDPRKRAAFVARLQAKGHDEKTIGDVLDGFADLAQEIIGESAWWNRGRRALGLIVDLVKALRS